MRERLQADLRPAMKAGDTTRVAVLRTTLAAIGNAEAVDASAGPMSAGLLGDVARRPLSDDDVRAIVVGERDELRSSADELAALGQPDAADELRRRADILDSYLA